MTAKTEDLQIEIFFIENTATCILNNGQEINFHIIYYVEKENMMH